MVLSNYTKGIVERLNHEALQNPNNDFVKVLDGTVGEYLENRDNHFLDVFLATAEGDYLDLHGNLFGLKRRENEDDDDFRNRILLDESIMQRTTDFENLSIGFWIYKEGVTNKTTLTSRNPYLKNEHDEDYIFICSGDDVQYLTGKFLLQDILFVD